MPTSHSKPRRKVHKRSGRPKEGRDSQGYHQGGATFEGRADGSSSDQIRGMADLPDDILGPILQAALCKKQKSADLEPIMGDKDAASWYQQESANSKFASTCRSVCRSWNRVICERCVKRVRLVRPGGSEGPALAPLLACRSVTHVRLECSSVPSSLSARLAMTSLEEERAAAHCDPFFRGLAAGFPLLARLDVELCLGWEALPDVALLLSHRTSLRELRLKFPARPRRRSASADVVAEDDTWQDSHGSQAFLDSWRAYHASLAGLNFGGLTRLETLTLDYSGLHFPNPMEELDLPVSDTIAQLPGLTALHLVVSDTGQVARLPLWLGELRPFASLRVGCSCYAAGHSPRQLAQSLGAMHTLRELQLDLGTLRATDAAMLVVLNSIETAVGGLRSLTSLAVSYRGISSLRPVPSLARMLFNPRLRRLRLVCDSHPQLTAPLPHLEELALEVNALPAHFQRDLFAFTPALRSLDLRLTDALMWPQMGAHLAGLTRLSVKTVPRVRGVTIRGAVSIDLGCMPALEMLRICNCRLLKFMPGVFSLGSATAVSLDCYCGSSPARYESCKEYAQSGWPCQQLSYGKAKRLFRDSRARMCGLEGQGLGLS